MLCSVCGIVYIRIHLVKYRLKLPLLKGIGVHQVMMMESPEYHRVHSDLKMKSNTNMGT